MQRTSAAAAFARFDVRVVDGNGSHARGFDGGASTK